MCCFASKGCVVVMCCFASQTVYPMLRYSPVYPMLTAAVTANATLWGPSQTSKRHPILQEWLQWFAWYGQSFLLFPC